jgi:hypothetical protein
VEEGGSVTEDLTIIDFLADLNVARLNTLEEIALLETAVRTEGVTVPGARGNVIAHPALAALATHRKVLAALVKQLDPRSESQSQKARRAVKERWEATKTTPTDRIYVPKVEHNGNGA